MKNISKDKLDLINQAMSDTKYILDDTKPYKGILEILTTWVILYALATLIFFIANEVNVYLELYTTNWYYPTYRISTIIIFTSLPIIYYIKFQKTAMSLKERDFLHGWIFIPILLSLWKMLFSITYYLNAEIMLQLYFTLPFDLIINIIGLFILYRYFKIPCLKVLLFINIAYTIFSTIWLSYFMNNAKTILIEISIMQIVRFIESNGIMIIVSFMAFILSYRRKYYD